MIVVPFVNQKGGVAKTNLTGNVGGELARRGYRVVLVDMDEQSNLSEWALGLGEEGAPPRVGTQDLFAGATAPPIDELLADSPAFRLRILPATYAAMHDLGPVLLGKPERLNRMLRACETLEPQTDFVLIDCPPNAGPFTKAALYAATHVLIPFKPTQESVSGIQLILSTLAEVREVNDIPLIAVVVTMMRPGNKYHPQIVEGIHRAFGSTPIHIVHERIDFQRAVSDGVPICALRPRSLEAESEIAKIADTFEQVAFGSVRSERSA